jgi:protein-S-isoprenylcysteine O-methyltransferase Ste14
MILARVVLQVLCLVGPLALGFLVRLSQARSPSAALAPSPQDRPVEQRRGSRVPTVLTYCAMLLFVLALNLPFTTFPGLEDTALLALAAIGLVVDAVGVGIAYWARSSLGAAWGLLPRAGGATGLVTSGPYARVRHPVYLGFSLGLLGIAVAFANWAALLLLLLLIVPGLLWRVREEERVLAEAFGDDYQLYRRRTKLLIPYLL